MFANHTATLSRYLISTDNELVELQDSENTSATHSRPGHLGTIQYDPSRLDKMVDILQKYEENFSRNSKVLLDTLNYLAATETVVFQRLCARLSTAGESY